MHSRPIDAAAVVKPTLPQPITAQQLMAQQATRSAQTREQQTATARNGLTSGTSAGGAQPIQTQSSATREAATNNMLLLPTCGDAVSAPKCDAARTIAIQRQPGLQDKAPAAAPRDGQQRQRVHATLQPGHSAQQRPPGAPPSSARVSTDPYTIDAAKQGT
jgi:hypothetical protein